MSAIFLMIFWLIRQSQADRGKLGSDRKPRADCNEEWPGVINIKANQLPLMKFSRMKSFW